MRRRWKRAVAAVVALAGILFAGGYLYLVHDAGSPPPPLSIDDQLVAPKGSVADGVWRCTSRGRIRIVGRWIEDALLPAGGATFRVTAPVDLTGLMQGRAARVEVTDSLVLIVLWRGSSMRITGRAGARSIRTACHLTA